MFIIITSFIFWGGGLLDENLDLAENFNWDYIGELSENRRIVKKGELYGFLNEKNAVVISPSYSQVYNFSEGLCAVKNAEGQWGYIDPQGNLVIPFAYEVANDFSCGLALVKTGGFYGYIDKTNQFVIPATYEEAYPFSENRACVRSGELYGFIDTMGTMVIPPSYEVAFDFAGGGAVVKQGSYTFVDDSGKNKMSAVWEQLSPQIGGGYLKAKKNGVWMFVDSGGNVLSDGYAYLGDFSDGLCPVGTDSGYGYINEAFELAIPAEWDSAGAFSEGFAPVSRGGFFGYIDKTGGLVTELLYADAGKVSAGFGAVCEAEGGYYFINPQMTASESKSDSGLEQEPARGFETVVDGQMLLLKIDYPFLQKGRENIPLDAAPIIRDGRTLLPIRHVVEALGGEVKWDPEEQKISLYYESHSVIMYVSEAGAFVDGRFVLLDVPPVIENNRTLVPVRFVIESLGCEVEWLPDGQEVLITY